MPLQQRNLLIFNCGIMVITDMVRGSSLANRGVGSLLDVQLA
jgi:hypothetical protein